MPCTDHDPSVDFGVAGSVVANVDEDSVDFLVDSVEHVPVEDVSINDNVAVGVIEDSFTAPMVS